MPISNAVPAPIIRGDVTDVTYGTGSSGRTLTITYTPAAGGSDIVVFEGTPSVLSALGDELIADTLASGVDPLGTLSWRVWDSTAGTAVLGATNVARVDVSSSEVVYRLGIPSSTERELLGYGMRGEDPPVSPSLPAYVIAQWDASDVNDTSGAIDQINDQQTGGYHLTSTGTARATLQATSGPGGGPAIFFDGTDDRYRLDGITRNQPHAIVITAEFLDSDDIAMDSYNSQIYHLAFSWNLNVYAGGGGSLSDSDQSYGSGYHTWVFYFNGDSSTIKRDNVLRATGGSNQPGSSNGVGISLGGAYDGASYYSMRIARLTLVDASNTSDVQSVSDDHATDYGTYSP